MNAIPSSKLSEMLIKMLGFIVNSIIFFFNICLRMKNLHMQSIRMLDNIYHYIDIFITTMQMTFVSKYRSDEVRQ